MFTKKQMSQNILRLECRRGVYRVNIFKESRRGKLWEYIRLLFSTQTNFNYMELHKVRGDDDIFTKNIIPELNGHSFVFYTHSRWGIAFYETKGFSDNKILLIF